MSGTGALLRTLRVLTLGVGLVTVVGVLATSLLIDQPDRIRLGGWYLVLLGIATVLPLLAGATAPWAGMRLLRVLNAVVVTEYAVLLLTLVVVTVGGADGEIPWFLTFTAAPVSAALVAGGRLAAWIVLAGSTLLIQVVRFLSDADWESAIANDVLVFFAAAALLLLFSVLIRAARELDESTAEALEAARERSEAEAEERVRDRMRVLVHDELLSLLTFGARDEPALRPAIADEASRMRQAIRDLHERPEPGHPPAVPTGGVVARLSAVITDELPGTPCSLDAAEGDVPGEVVDAVEGALRQALINVRRHAGTGAAATVTLDASDDRVHVVVQDDGEGFAPADVPPERMGIASSIVGRLAAIPGGAAHVLSRPGAGTTVTIEWVRPGTAPEDAAPAEGVLAGEGDGVRRGLLVAGAVFLLAQAALAWLAAQRGEPLVPWIALAGVAAGLLGMGWRTLGPPSPLRTGFVLASTALTSALSLVPVLRDPLRYGDLWYLPALGFVLLALAIRGRVGYALLGGAAAAGFAIAGLGMQQNDPADVVAATTRMIAVLGIGVCLVVATTRTRARAAAVRAHELDAVRASAFDSAARRALRDRSRELEALVAPVLAALERGDALTPDEQRECAALEGRLRDQYRAGRLARPALNASAMDARRRGIDVVLLDDGNDRVLTESELDRVVDWMSDTLDAASRGPVTGRILPVGRDGIASIVIGDDVAVLREEQLEAYSRPTSVRGS